MSLTDYIMQNLSYSLKNVNSQLVELSTWEYTFLNYGIETNPSKMEVVRTYPVPKTRKQLKSFLGLTNNYRRFVKYFAKITAPLNCLLKKDTEYNWTSVCDESFNLLKQKLISSPILAFADTPKHFFLFL